MNQPVPVTGQLVDFCVEARRASLDQDVTRRAVNAFVDTVGVAVAGAHEPVVTAMHSALRLTGGAGAATVLGTGRQVDGHGAAVVNAVAGHAMDFDDHLSDVNGHPSVVLVPPVLALGEELGLPGEPMLRAYVIGHQVMCAVSAALPVRAHWTAGWHATETVGVLGAVAAAGTLLQLTTSEMHHAFGIAASMAAGSRQNCGFSVKPVHAGMAAGNGILAARLAAAGVDADPHQLEAPLGYFAVFGKDPDLTAVAPVLKERWTLSTRGLNVKAFPACYAVHPAGEAALEIRDHGLDPDSVTDVTVTVQPTGLTGPIHHDPVTADQARFSMEYTVAAALADGRLTADSFDDAQVTRPALRRLMATVRTAEAAVPPFGPPDFTRWYATVEVTTSDGAQHRARRGMPHGSAHDPLSDEELDQKFLDCLRSPGSVFDGPTLLAALRDLPSARNTAQLLGPARSRTAPIL
ncbi:MULTISPECIES: MmgE/PrpD family protein [unclassified Streptomyces]|uniref:MmgE/PrpD family protein n=1 Tax=unclassified Streptomyces TaxID=2593676 RepID=UPI0004AE4D01|nr:MULTISPECIES: MmgE/PrpD family protein [unclassified Streptomyces]MYR76049.1 MmgE/PrpD family protein [Streptomyces sp. SID4925]MYY19925.1 MmgE/PrpD family protein [Streptomyces sp. SID4912]SBU94469.1 2-methylcitrate dehydratase PrpD [Streptomyces sp. OspMP-M45]SCD42394.1 2-methylcitrate dehydratase PrpD [Streptomyces sp. DpondAA-D4]